MLFVWHTRWCVLQKLSTQLDSIENQKKNNIKQTKTQTIKKTKQHQTHKQITDTQATPQKHRSFLTLHLLGVVGSRRASNSRIVWREQAPPQHCSVETHHVVLSDGGTERKNKKEGCGLFKRNVKHTQTSRQTLCPVVKLVLNKMLHDSSCCM
jgi:hypothetical protein